MAEASVTVVADEFKKTLKIFETFSKQGYVRSTVTATVIENRLEFLLQTDHALVRAQPLTATVVGSLPRYSFDPALLLKMTFVKGPITLSWTNENSLLLLTNGKLRAELRVAIPKHVEPRVSRQNLCELEIPYGVMCAFRKYLDLQCSYYKTKKDYLPIQIQTLDNGQVIAIGGDGGYSMGYIKTPIICNTPFQVSIPKYAFDCMFPKVAKELDSTAMVKFGARDNSVLLDNGSIRAMLGCLTDRPDVLPDNPTDGTKSSCEFIPKTLTESIKPLLGVIPDKDRSGTVLKVALGATTMDLSVQHKDTGLGAVEGVPGVGNIYHEVNVRSSTINMHPQAFKDYTALFDVERGKMYYCGNSVCYQGAVKAGGMDLEIGYLFPTVM